MTDKIDALDLLREYISIHSLIIGRNVKYDSLSWDEQIRIKRILALLNAYLDGEIIRYRETKTDIKTILEKTDNDEKLVFINDFFSFRLISLPEISDSDFDALLAKIKGLQGNSDVVDSAIDWQRKLGLPIDRRLMLEMMMAARLKSSELSNIYSGILEGDASVGLVINTVETLYFEHLYESDKFIDEIIVGLMGHVFKRSFTKEELVLKFGYPNETDNELFDYGMDKF